MKKTAISVLVFVLLVAGCTKRNEGVTSSETRCGTTMGPLFTSVRAIVRTNCAIAGCHTGTNAQNGINFSDDCTIVAEASLIKTRAVDMAGTSSQMPPPPSAPLSATDRQKISDWVNAGGHLSD